MPEHRVAFELGDPHSLYPPHALLDAGWYKVIVGHHRDINIHGNRWASVLGRNARALCDLRVSSRMAHTHIAR